MRRAAVLLLVLLSALPIAASAQVQSGVLMQGGPIGTFPTPPARTDLMDAWNDTETWQPPGTYFSQCMAWLYVPSQTYYLERVEFMAGAVPGTVTVEVRADDGSGMPTGALLATATYDETSPIGWQGGNLDTPVQVTAGVGVYVIYHPVVGAPVTGVFSGTPIQNWWADECVTWQGPCGLPWDCLCWMVRFYGSYEIVPTHPTTWGRVRSLYR